MFSFISDATLRARASSLAAVHTAYLSSATFVLCCSRRALQRSFRVVVSWRENDELRAPRAVCGLIVKLMDGLNLALTRHATLRAPPRCSQEPVFTAALLYICGR